MLVLFPGYKIVNADVLLKIKDEECEKKSLVNEKKNSVPGEDFPCHFLALHTSNTQTAYLVSGSPL